MKLLSKAVMLFVAVLATSLMSAQDQKPASPPATAMGKINGASITIEYSSPSVKGRPIWGELVPYGKIWRAGANKPTTFETTKLLMVEGKELPAGKYALYVIPEKDSATVIFGKDPSVGYNKYDDSYKQLSVVVKTKKAKEMTENLVYSINKDNVTLTWDNLDIPVKIK